MILALAHHPEERDPFVLLGLSSRRQVLAIDMPPQRGELAELVRPPRERLIQVGEGGDAEVALPRYLQELLAQERPRSCARVMMGQAAEISKGARLHRC